MCHGGHMQPCGGQFVSTYGGPNGPINMVRNEDGKCMSSHPNYCHYGYAQSDTEATLQIDIDSDVIAKMEDYFQLPEDELMEIISQECGVEQ